jgi:hypothetical protein
MQSQSRWRQALLGAIFFAAVVATWVAAFELNQLWLVPLAFAAELLAYWWLTRKAPRK